MRIRRRRHLLEIELAVVILIDENRPAGESRLSDIEFTVKLTSRNVVPEMAPDGTADNTQRDSNRSTERPRS